MFTINVIEQLLKTSDQQLKNLEETYRSIPATRCKHRAHCCSMFPEMSLIEALLLNIFDNIETMSGHFPEWLKLFMDMYFHDLSFLFSYLVF